MPRTASSVMLPALEAMAWSVRDSASRMDPWAACPISRKAGTSKATSSWPSTACKCPTMESAGICFRLN
ncbi:hypothetical protein G6F60_014956 [Rhizopus arrhizus]|nr:hypothetical protein G6F60_014956 [Rhizopus arrhizus]